MSSTILNSIKVATRLKPVSSSLFAALLKQSPPPSTKEICTALRKYRYNPLPKHQVERLARHCSTTLQSDTMLSIFENPAQYGLQLDAPIARELMRGLVVQAMGSRRYDLIWKALGVFALEEPSLQKDVAVLGTALYAVMESGAAATDEITALTKHLLHNFSISNLPKITIEAGDARRAILDFEPLHVSLEGALERTKLGPTEQGVQALQQGLNERMKAWRKIGGGGRQWKDYLTNVDNVKMLPKKRPKVQNSTTEEAQNATNV